MVWYGDDGGAAFVWSSHFKINFISQWRGFFPIFNCLGGGVSAPFADAVMWYLGSCLSFYMMGNQATFSSIRWSSGLVGLTVR